MKEDMMVVGLRAVGDGNILEVELVSLVVAKKKTDVMGQIMGGDVMGALKTVRASDEQHHTKIYLPREWCSQNNIMLFRSLTLDVELADKKRIAGEQ